MARFWVILAVWLAFAGSASALSPAEQPPAGFTPRQYIDSSGCVFVRADSGWQARLGRDGAPVCGYPPTLSLRELAPPPPEKDLAAHQGIEAQLAARVAVAVGAHGEKSAPVQQVAPEKGPLGSLGADIGAELAQGPALRAAMSGTSARKNRLCDLLGAAPQGSAPAHEATYGYCGALVPLDLPSLAQRSHDKPPALSTAALAPAAKPDAPRPDAPPLDAPRPDTKPAPAAPPKAQAQAKAKAKAQAKAKAKATKVPPATAAKPAETGRDMIPAGARFVQVGVYAEQRNAARAAAKVAGLGMPVAQAQGKANGKPAQVIMAGPFQGREAVVVALDRLRKAGYRDAYARR